MENYSLFLAAKYCNAQTRIALVRSRHGPHKFILNSIPAISDVDNKAVTVNIIYVSATIKHCFIFVRVSCVFTTRFLHVKFV